MDGDKLVAEADIFPVWRDVIDALAEDIGLSIRASGERELGEAAGREGMIVTAITEGISVDFVTKAGAGGKVGALIESARADDLQEARNAGHWFEAGIHRDFTTRADDLFGSGYLTREERIGLSNAIGDALTAFSENIAENLPHLYNRDPYTDPSRLQQVTENNSDPSGRKKEITMSDETRLAELEESVRQVNTKLAEAEAKASETDTALAEATARAEKAEDRLLMAEARSKVTETVTANGTGLPQRAIDRAIDEALKDSPPVTEDGKLDSDKLAERAEAAIKTEREYLTEAAGGTVKGMGTSATTVDDAEAKNNLAGAFGRLGLTETAAKRAAEGR